MVGLNAGAIIGFAARDDWGLVGFFSAFLLAFTVLFVHDVREEKRLNDFYYPR
jgi:hypothetical protein